MKRVISKNSTSKKNFYLLVLGCLKESTNLSKIIKELSISKQQLNYYLRGLKKQGFIYDKGNGWWELTPKGKNPTKYGNFYEKDSIRGHAYVWNVKITKEIKNWYRRIEILEKNKINYVLVGTLKNIPRIKILGRKIWLCNDHFRIFDIEKSSYYGKDAIESRNNSALQVLRIIQGLESKLGVSLKPYQYEFRKEHYALIKNDLAIDHNNKGIIVRIKDENNEEFLLMDDSLEEGGELENVGKKAYKTNIPMQKWWIDQKNTNFKVTPTFLLENLNKLTQVQLIEQQNKAEYSRDLVQHKNAIKQMGNNTDANTKSTEMLAQSIKDMQVAFIEQIELLREEIKGLKRDDTSKEA
jgi:predicted transcriptional regulator